MDTFDVDKLMRYDVLKEEWDANAGREHKPPGAKPDDKSAGTASRPDPNPSSPPQPSPPPSTVLQHPPAIESLRRGQRLEFVHGDRKWQAVYWGKDAQGHVIAHNTFKDWTLTRLDLHQYIDKIFAESEPDFELVRTIEQCLRDADKGHAQAA